MQTYDATPTADPALAIFAHELREPLASILIAAQAASETAGDDLTGREMWAIVERQGRYLARLIDQVLELSREPRHKTELSKEWFDLGATILHAVEAVKPRLVSRQHRLTVSLPPDPTYVLADALRLRQVVINLLANAAKYTGCGGQINVGLKTMHSLVIIEVRDNGVGITPELLPQVFDLFRQGPKPGGANFSGLGIGLALVKSLVELHGGSVSAHSGGTGTGATFLVLLPQAGPGACQRRDDAPVMHVNLDAEPVWADNAMLDA